jgi:hypothetical protein
MTVPGDPTTTLMVLLDPVSQRTGEKDLKKVSRSQSIAHKNSTLCKVSRPSFVF